MAVQSARSIYTELFFQARNFSEWVAKRLNSHFTAARASFRPLRTRLCIQSSNRRLFLQDAQPCCVHNVFFTQFFLLDSRGPSCTYIKVYVLRLVHPSSLCFCCLNDQKTRENRRTRSLANCCCCCEWNFRVFLFGFLSVYQQTLHSHYSCLITNAGSNLRTSFSLRLYWTNTCSDSYLIKISLAAQRARARETCHSNNFATQIETRRNNFTFAVFWFEY